ncbi:MAG: FAD binding domain-containing protein [Anaerolineales bacterium]|nr:FAD binding domain-containing protein [Anaerolineales bacterium]
MIIEYHAPETIAEAQQLLSRKKPVTRVLGGGSILNRPSKDDFAVVDIQKLSLGSYFETDGKTIIGAGLTMQQLLDKKPGAALEKAIHHEATYNIRQVATVVGRLVGGDGRSALLITFAVLDPEVIMDTDKINMMGVLSSKKEKLSGKLITELEFTTPDKCQYEYVARTPADLPVVGVAAALWGDQRLRISIGGYGEMPKVAYDGIPEKKKALESVIETLSNAGDQWASAEYRLDVTKTLITRILTEFTL